MPSIKEANILQAKQTLPGWWWSSGLSACWSTRRRAWRSQPWGLQDHRRGWGIGRHKWEPGFQVFWNQHLCLMCQHHEWRSAIIREVWPREVCSITKKWKPELVIAQRLIWTKVVKQKFSQQPLFLKVWIGYIFISLNCKLQRYCGKIMALKGKESWSHDAHLHMWPPECFPYIKGRKVEARIWQKSLMKCQIEFSFSNGIVRTVYTKLPA